jgi:hypothetical protein
MITCPFCDSDNYHFIGIADYDQLDASLEFKCLGRCGKIFFGMYSFMYFEDEEGHEINGEF